MLKSVLITAPIAFVLVFITAFLFSLCCSPFIAVLLGLAAGFLCAFFEKPSGIEKAATRGAIAGAIAGGAAFLGQMVGQLLSSIVQLYYASPAACPLGLCSWAAAPVSNSAYLLNAVLLSCLCSIGLLATMAGLGALGAFLWFQLIGRKNEQPASVIETQTGGL
jgi:MFS family permease